MQDIVHRTEKAVTDFFGTKIALSVKARETVLHGLCAKKPISPDLLWGVLKASPSVAAIFLSNGFDLTDLRGPDDFISLRAQDREYNPEKAILAALSSVRGELTEASKAAAERGVVTELDIVNSLVENAASHHRSFINIVLTNIFTRQDEFDPDYENNQIWPLGDWRRYQLRLVKHLEAKLKAIPLIDPHHSEQQFVFYYDGKQIRLLPFGAFGIYTIAGPERDDAGAFLARSNLSHGSELFAAEALDELEYLINSDARESAFQEFFERRPEFLLGMEYRRHHSQLVLQIDTNSSMIPDFFLEKYDRNFVDILDLKRPVARLAKYPTHRQGLRAAFHEAADQLRQYRNWFDDPRNRELFREKYPELDCYKPRVIVVMGRNKDFYSEQDRIMLEDDLPRHLTLRTYDDVLGMAKRYKQFKNRE